MVKKEETVINGERKKKTQGRVKIDMKIIEKQSNRQVTFSKRKQGLFNKASQLCVLTGAEVAIIVQSLTGKRVFAFGHKSVDSVINRFLHNRIREENYSVENGGDYEDEEYHRVCKELEVEIKAEQGVVVNDDDGGGFWWEREVDELQLAELETYEAALMELMNNVDTKANLLSRSSSSSSLVVGEGLSGFTGFNPATDAYSKSFDGSLDYNYPSFTCDDFLV